MWMRIGGVPAMSSSGLKLRCEIIPPLGSCLSKLRPFSHTARLAPRVKRVAGSFNHDFGFVSDSDGPCRVAVFGLQGAILVQRRGRAHEAMICTYEKTRNE
jgi:hypothetical protein